MTMTSKFSNMMSLSYFLTFPRFFVKFSYWSKFHVNLITGSRVTIIFLCKRLIRNLQIRNIHFWVLPNIWRLVRVRDTTFGMNVSKEMLLNAAKCQRYNFHCFGVIKGKPAGGKISPPPSPPKLGLSYEIL